MTNTALQQGVMQQYGGNCRTGNATKRSDTSSLIVEDVIALFFACARVGAPSPVTGDVERQPETDLAVARCRSDSADGSLSKNRNVSGQAKPSGMASSGASAPSRGLSSDRY